MGMFVMIDGRSTRVSSSLGTLATVNQAELQGVEEAARFLQGLAPSGSRIEIFTDSQACLKALEGIKIRSRLVKGCHEELNRLGRGRFVTLRWVPGHMGVVGNEEADGLAKVGAMGNAVGPEPLLPVSYEFVKGKIRCWMRSQWERNWRDTPGLRQAKMGIRPQRDGDLTAVLKLSRTELRYLVMVLTGHANLGSHLFKMGLRDSAGCPKCGGLEETPEHYMGRCPAFFMQRLQRFGWTHFVGMEWRDESYVKLAGFMRDTGRLGEFL